jgi:hypothetical protein
VGEIARQEVAESPTNRERWASESGRGGASFELCYPIPIDLRQSRLGRGIHLVVPLDLRHRWRAGLLAPPRSEAAAPGRSDEMPHDQRNKITRMESRSILGAQVRNLTCLSFKRTGHLPSQIGESLARSHPLADGTRSVVMRQQWAPLSDHD